MSFELPVSRGKEDFWRPLRRWVRLLTIVLRSQTPTVATVLLSQLSQLRARVCRCKPTYVFLFGFSNRCLEFVLELISLRRDFVLKLIFYYSRLFLLHRLWSCSPQTVNHEAWLAWLLRTCHIFDLFFFVPSLLSLGFLLLCTYIMPAFVYLQVILVPCLPLLTRAMA